MRLLFIDGRTRRPTGNASLCPWERQFTVFPIRAKQSTRGGGPASPKTCKQNPKKCSALLRLDRRSGIARGGAARYGWHHFGVTPFGVAPYYDVKP